MISIKLTGRVLDWDHEEFENITISPDQVSDYEGRGYFTMEVVGNIISCREIAPCDGDIQIQLKSGMYGRFASSGGHTNMGYSGYCKGFVYLGGKRKALVDWWMLFPNKEHHYAAQQDKSQAEQIIRSAIERLAGQQVTRVPRGYAFNIASKSVLIDPPH